MKSKLLIFLIAIVAAFAIYKIWFSESKFLSVLVFSKTEGFRHESIEDGKIAMLEMAKKHGFKVDTTEDASYFKENTLQNYNVVVFLNTTGDVLNDAQQLEFNRFIQAGGGFVGIHSATDTEYDWPWYGDLVGAYFKSHPNNPNVREGTSKVLDKTHICSQHLPDDWTRMDEWYNYKDIRSHINVVMNLDETSYEGGENGENHPITWYHEFDGGRSWYTGMGHTSESFSEPDFLQMVWGGIQWVANEQKPVDFNRSTVAPEENRFQKVVLETNLNEPMELEMLPDGRIIFVERRGDVKMYDPETDTVTVINTFDVFSRLEDGLLGIALDPKFEDNNWLYTYYSPPNVDYNLLSRFTFAGDAIDMDSEVEVLRVDTQRDTCCHSGGSIEFGPGGNLYLSTGDNTNPHESNGYAPIDERDGHKYFDALRTSSNTNDLRGKILRIHPEEDGSYTIPDGNLFPKDGSGGRPEIYVMGCRNPWRMHVDMNTGYLYWGDVGPDAGEDSLGMGPRGHDEVNMAKEAGYYGWPLFNGDNKAYHQRTFETGQLGEAFDPAKPVNNSPNNTGAKDLPPANPAYIWYPYSESKEFPLVGDGGRNAMAGPVYYYNDYEDNPGRFPEYYDKKFFAYDWMRGWIIAVTQNEDGSIDRMERFLPSIEWNNAADIIMSPKGDMYVLEYGTAWFSQNEDARLVHLKYISGNRPPVAKLEADKTVGQVPLTVNFSASNSIDYDGDEVRYKWYFDDDQVKSTDAEASYTFEKEGNYTVRLVVDDGQGETNEAEIEIIAGNSMPEIAFDFEGNRSFFFDNQSLNYSVSVNDEEDGSIGNGIEENRVVISIDFLEKGYDVNQIALGHQAAQEASQFAVGQDLIANSDCRACHAVNKRIAGPSYQEVAERYKDEPTIIGTLAERIIKGSNGVWGDQLMSAHPQLTKNETELMVKYILSLSDEANLADGLPPTGTYALDKHKPGAIEGAYVINASYSDNGGKNVGPLTARETVVLRAPIIGATDFDEEENAQTFNLEAGQFPGVEQDLSILIGNGGTKVMFKEIDLTGIDGLEIAASANSMFAQGGKIEFRLDDPEGELYASFDLETTLSMDMPPAQKAVTPVKGAHDIYILFVPADPDKTEPVGAMVYIKFMRGLEG